MCFSEPAQRGLDQLIAALMVPNKANSTKESKTMTQNEDILTTVVENGRIETWTAAEMEAEIEFECRERGLSADETAAAVAFALAHSQLSDA